MRCVVMGEGKDGKSVVLSDDNAPRSTEVECRSGNWSFMTEVWGTDGTPLIPLGNWDGYILQAKSVISDGENMNCV